MSDAMKRALLDSWAAEPDQTFDAFFEQAPIFMVSVDGTWSIVRVSAYWAEALGRPAEALMGRKIAEFLTAESAARLETEIQPAFSESHTVEGAELDFRTASGDTLPVVMSARAQVERGVVQRVLAVMYDNSEARRTQARLRAAIDAAEEASRAKSRFLAAMGHEIRTPMNAILGFAQLLKMSDLDDRRKAHVDAIQSAGGTLMNLLTDLLDLSQAEAGQLRIDDEPFDLDAFLGQLADWWQTAAAEKGLRMRIAKDQGLPKRIVSDRGRIQQVLNNYLGNAVKFTEAGRITLAIEEVPADPGLRRIRFEVSDTGPGLTPAQADQLFKPFVQFDTDYSKERGGWGLGLSICNEIATAMDGCVGVCSTPGEGSTFFFEVDVRAVEADAPETAETHGSGETDPAPPVTASSLDILVAEDNEMSRAMLREMLSELGHRVQTTEDGLKAIEALERDRFDLVFMDVMMPQLDGISAVRRIRKADPPASQTPIVACSAHTSDTERYRKAGMDAFLPKPVDRRRLESLIAQFGTQAKTPGPEHSRS